MLGIKLNIIKILLRNIWKMLEIKRRKGLKLRICMFFSENFSRISVQVSSKIILLSWIYLKIKLLYILEILWLVMLNKLKIWQLNRLKTSFRLTRKKCLTFWPFGLKDSQKIHYLFSMPELLEGWKNNRRFSWISLIFRWRFILQEWQKKISSSCKSSKKKPNKLSKRKKLHRVNNLRNKRKQKRYSNKNSQAKSFPFQAAIIVPFLSFGQDNSLMKKLFQ